MEKSFLTRQDHEITDRPELRMVVLEQYEGSREGWGTWSTLHSWQR